jgi:glyoxylase-like metal-dependent hydrolase (beta-lactamase superfamily II)
MTFDSNITYIECGSQHVLVDTGTGLFSERLNQDLIRLGCSLEKITDVVLTHSHIDHIGGIVPLLENDGLVIHLHRLEAENINHGDMTLTLIDTFGGELPDLRVEDLLEDGQVLNFGEVTFKVIHTPGHSIGSICLHEEDLGLLITGDTLFAGGSFGRVDLPSGDPASLVRSLKKISRLDFERALPGHMNAIPNNGPRAAKLSYDIARSMFRAE